jgi:hypothetical protein
LHMYSSIQLSLVKRASEVRGFGWFRVDQRDFEFKPP